MSGNGHHEKAALLLVRTKQIEEALDMCTTHHVLISEDMAEDMTPQKTGHGRANELDFTRSTSCMICCRECG